MLPWSPKPHLSQPGFGIACVVVDAVVVSGSSSAGYRSPLLIFANPAPKSSQHDQTLTRIPFTDNAVAFSASNGNGEIFDWVALNFLSMSSRKGLSCGFCTQFDMLEGLDHGARRANVMPVPQPCET
jgi:hypothetical protein